MAALSGRVAVVTGAARGIGREEALLLAREGARVVVNNRRSAAGSNRPQSGGAVVDEILAAGGQALLNEDDVSTWEGAQRLIEQAVDAYGRLDVLVNNAGFLLDRPVAEMTEAEWDESIRVNLKGHFAPCRSALRYWRSQWLAGRREGGRIVNTGSQAGLFGRAGRVAYAAAKAGVTGLTFALAHEAAEFGVTCNSIYPRARTRQTARLEAESLTPASQADGFDPWSPAHVAPVVGWLASDAAAGVNGQMFIVFGGSVWLLNAYDVRAALDQETPWTVAELIQEGHRLFRAGAPGAGHGPWPAADMLERQRLGLAAQRGREV